jgi:ABC-type uncharacterized transport system ATPase subunit
METVNAVEMRDITKRFGEVVATTRCAWKCGGRILSLLGKTAAERPPL